ncbi:voltage-dependent calcium channel gamma-7 subunit-like [Onychostruthus taczanowskii]|uniref:voltage-dependent calcium channel gamma-7 subunit-like n=1 Tax=Onychostruthus taczanowskii TaxID=356909 RepID=UPI001B809EE0|nr:voltage-dependent calcium channel gamma-7 subunit-like [Onychostruthus taczanowskii]
MLGREKGRCVASEYFLEPELNLVTENTENILISPISGNFALPGLSLVVGLVLYISSINDEVMNRPGGSEQYFQYRYGWSFAFAASSFLLKEGAGVMSVYSCHSGVTQLSLSCHSGGRGRSPSDVPSDVSIQMTQNYPPAIKYPQRPPPHPHLSTSPC